jgi:dGTPase
MTRDARRIVADLFAAFLADPALLPPAHRAAARSPRRVADHIAGMTDRYAMKEHARIFGSGDQGNLFRHGDSDLTTESTEKNRET